MNQQELARKTGVSQSQICRILKGFSNPRPALLAKILRVTGWTPRITRAGRIEFVGAAKTMRKSK